nr:hypothetical protein [Tanacetum cinerariifolium]
IETSDDTVMDDVSKQGRMIADMDADVDVSLEDAKEVIVEKSADVVESANVQGRKAVSQVQIYQIDFKHANKVLSMQDDKGEPTELQEVVKVVTTAKLIIEVVTTASVTLTAAAPQLTTAVAPTLTTAPSDARRRKGVVIRDPQETATPSTIIHSEAKSKDKERRYSLTRFTLDQMLNNVRLEVEEESEVSLELLRFIRQQHQEGFQLE